MTCSRCDHFTMKAAAEASVEGYLRYLQIQALENSKAQLIYVPTDAGLPVTEAQRLAPVPAPQDE